MMYSILFDLDGTLFDTSEGIIRGIEAAEKHLQLEALPYEIKKSFIGPPLKESFSLYYGLTEDQSNMALKIFREYYSEKGKYECTPYNGIRELLAKVMYYNNKVFVATSKPTVFAKDIVAYFGLEDYFTDVIGSNLDNSRSKKKDIIQYVLNKYMCRLDYTIMVGDKSQDIQGARLNGIRSIAVTYGFGSIEEIEESRPDMIADTVEDISSYIKELGWW